MAELLGRAGYGITETLEEASLVVVETCAIRQKAEDKVYSLLGRLNKRRREGVPLKIVLCGCVVTPDAAGELVEEHGVDVVLGPRRVARIADAVAASNEGPVIDLGGEWMLPPDDVTAPDIKGLSAFVTVMQGCSNACTFCVVPSRRGAAQSRPVEDIVSELRVLERRGYKEVTLLGQNISYYGLDRPKSARLADLLKAVEAETGIPRIRFATSHPAYIDERFVETFGALRRVMPHLHLPVQSGSDRLLRLMRRGYTAERYLGIVRAIRAARPGTAVTTDIITGFDGETPVDHQATLDLVKAAELDGAYVFPYSERPGTPAVDSGLSSVARESGDIAAVGKVEKRERLRRCQEVLDAVAASALQRRRASIGSTAEVLVETEGQGRTEGNIQARFSGGRPGEFLQVRIVDATPYALRVEPLDGGADLTAPGAPRVDRARTSVAGVEAPA